MLRAASALFIFQSAKPAVTPEAAWVTKVPSAELPDHADKAHGHAAKRMAAATSASPTLNGDVQLP
jgi:hypothetical protein